MQIKNLSELMVNLSYCSIFFEDKQITNEINRLEERIDYLKSILIMQAALATRDRKDAERLVSILDFMIAVDKISDAAGDIAVLAENGIAIDIGLKNFFLNTSTTLVYSLKVTKKSIFAGKTIEEIYGMVREIFDVLAIRRNNEYILSPTKNIRISVGDILFITGLAENIKVLLEREGRKYTTRGIGQVEEGLIDLLLNIKDISELMVDLAYSALFTHSRELAKELTSIEETIDRLTHEFKILTMRSRELNKMEKIGMIEIADACEAMGDAAMDMTFGLRKGLEPHPLIDEVLESTDERIALIKVDEEMMNKNIIDLGLDKYSIEILAMRRGDEWLVVPPSTGLVLKKDDVLLIRYYSEAEDFVSKVASEEEREETRKDIQEYEKGRE
jgi:uncharacterized protein with PhoU and TrkA domain